jgi:hypothetical protein
VPGGKPLVTLSDARNYILRLPKAEQQSRSVQYCIEALLMAAEGRGPVYTAHAGVVQMIHGKPKIGVPTTGKKEPRWRRSKRA